MLVRGPPDAAVIALAVNDNFFNGMFCKIRGIKECFHLTALPVSAFLYVQLVGELKQSLYCSVVDKTRWTGAAIPAPRVFFRGRHPV
ncbi:MAG: hypothetical protein CSA22_00175 [Deltaproteobacteria bacterium]|nr:MAG: hypothetical protein CSA22_00175 [Deltaproteobacteria bacterium]